MPEMVPLLENGKSGASLASLNHIDGQGNVKDKSLLD